MGKQTRLFELNATVENPLRIFFLCGSHFNRYHLNKDKRKNLQSYIESLQTTYKCIILEDNFLFIDTANSLNYNDIGLKGLKLIENLTSAFSDKIIIFHESLSTAAEIGLFSGDKDHNKKMLILVPDALSVEENYISGFISLAYDHYEFIDHNIDIINYFPTIEEAYISEHTKKLHTYFHGGQIPKGLKRNLEERFESFSRLHIILKNKKFEKELYKKSDIGLYEINNGVLDISIPLHMLIGYLIALFNEPNFAARIRSEVDIQDFKVEERIKSEKKIKKIRMTKSVIYKVISDFKETIGSYFINTLHDIESINDITGCNIKVLNVEADFNKVINYFVYLLYAMKFISIKDNKLQISVNFKSVYKEYEGLLRKKNLSLMERLTV